MSKELYRQAQRVKPCGVVGIQAMRKIKREHQMAKVNEVAIDAYSANAVIAVFDAINEVNRDKLIRMPVARVVEICFSVLNKPAAA